MSWFPGSVISSARIAAPARHTKGSAAASLLFNHLLGEKLPQNAVHCVIAAMSHLAGNHGRYDPSTPAINTTYPSTVEGILAPSYKM